MREILLISCFFIIPSLGQAQIFGKLSDALDTALDDSFQKITDKIAIGLLEKFVEKTMNGEAAATDSLEQYQPDSTATRNTTDLSSIFGSSSSKKKVDKVFQFDYEMIMTISAKENTNSIDYLIPKTGSYVGVKMQNIMVVTDFESDESYTVVNGSLTSFNMSKILEKYTDKNMYKEGEFTITKTGRKDVINGYNCEEYILKSDSQKTEAWVTGEFVNFDIHPSSSMARFVDYYKEDDKNGFAMRIISYDENNSKTTMEVKSITEKTNTIDLSQY